MSSLPISILILSKNEERSIQACIRSVSGFTEDIVVLDSSSDDATVALAESAGARVVNFQWNGQYPKKKQWGLDNAGLKHDWSMLLDADERCSEELARELPYLLSLEDVVAFDLPLRYFWAGKELRHGQRVVKRSIFRRSQTHFPVVDDLDAPGITEVEGHYQPEVSGCVRPSKSALLHDDPDPLSDWFARHNRYSDWEAYLRLREQAREDIRSHRSRQGRIFDRLPFKPAVIFIYNLLVRGGVLDGRAGLEYAGSLAFYQWQISMKVREAQARGRGGELHTAVKPTEAASVHDS